MTLRTEPMTDEQWQILEAMVARILPSDDGPGSREANVIGFFQWAYGQRFFELSRRRIAEGVDFLNSLSIYRRKKPFVNCVPVEQDIVLAELSGVSHHAIQHFLQTVINLTLAGFLCDPKYGGNRDRRGWEYIGSGVWHPNVNSVGG